MFRVMFRETTEEAKVVALKGTELVTLVFGQLYLRGQAPVEPSCYATFGEAPVGEGLEPTVLTSLVGIAGFHEDNIVEIDSTEGRTVTDDPIRHFIKCHGEPCIDQLGASGSKLLFANQEVGVVVGAGLVADQGVNAPPPPMRTSNSSTMSSTARSCSSVICFPRPETPAILARQRETSSAKWASSAGWWSTAPVTASSPEFSGTR